MAYKIASLTWGGAVHNFWDFYPKYDCNNASAMCTSWRIVEADYAQNPVTESSSGPKHRGCRKQSKARNMLDRFRDHPDGILAFMRDFSVQFDNNLSDRNLRVMKLPQKIFDTFRCFDARADSCRIRKYVSTVRENGINALLRIFLENPFIPAVNTA